MNEKLTPEQKKILFESGTEAPFSGIYVNHFEDGSYACINCGNILFDSTSKFDSHCGWPSFDTAIDGSVTYHNDESHGMIRTEVRCASCEGHLGHVFKDGPTDTSDRYCINSAILDFNQK